MALTMVVLARSPSLIIANGFGCPQHLLMLYECFH